MCGSACFISLATYLHRQPFSLVVDPARLQVLVVLQLLMRDALTKPELVHLLHLVRASYPDGRLVVVVVGRVVYAQVNVIVVEVVLYLVHRRLSNSTK